MRPPPLPVSNWLPREHAADVMRNLSSRRGQIQWHKEREGTHVVHAQVPLSEMFGYAPDLRSRTRGHSTFTMQFERYQPFHPAGDNDDSCDSLVGAPRKPAPTLRKSSVALPEPEVDRLED